MKISTVGWYGKKNVGDEAFREVLGRFFSGHDVEFVTPPHRCSASDVVVLGGGAVASPYYIDVLPDLPRFAIGIDLAYESEADLLAAAQFRSIFVRTKSDAETLRSKVSCPVTAIPDLAFYLQPTNTDVLTRYKRHQGRKTVGVLVTDYVNPAIDRPHDKFATRAWNFIVKLAAELDALWEQGYEVMLIPCSTGGYGDDRRMNLDLAAFMKYEPTNILNTIEPQDMIDLIADCDFTICQRFHAHVFSIIAGTPFVSIEFTRKVKLLLEENGLTHWIGGTYLNKSTFDFSKVQSVLQSFTESDNLVLRDKACVYHDELQNIKLQVLQDLSQAVS